MSAGDPRWRATASSAAGMTSGTTRPTGVTDPPAGMNTVASPRAVLEELLAYTPPLVPFAWSR